VHAHGARVRARSSFVTACPHAGTMSVPACGHAVSLPAAGATSTMAHRVRVRLGFGLGLGLGLGFVDIRVKVSVR